jgi:hypothetical protein
MEWVLVFWINAQSNFMVHSKYESQIDCENNISLYERAFQQANSKMVAECKPLGREHKKRNKSNIVYKRPQRVSRILKTAEVYLFAKS